MRRTLPLTVVYIVLAVLITWPAAGQMGQIVPGGVRTQVWDSLWGVDWVARSLISGQWPWFHDGLNHPHGASVWIADPISSSLVSPLVAFFGVPVGYTVLIMAHIAFAGVVAHRFADEWLTWRSRSNGPRYHLASWVAGVGFATAPVLLSQVHNGDLSAVGMGWGALAVWMSWRAVVGGARRDMALFMAVLLAAATVGESVLMSSAIFIAPIALLAAPQMRIRRRRLSIVGWTAATVIGTGLLHLFLLSDLAGVQGPYRGFAPETVRRAVGAAEPLLTLLPGRPDALPSAWVRAGEGFIHLHYLAIVLVLLALSTLRGRRNGTGFVWAGGLAGLILALGPVLVHRGIPLILWEQRAIPLPYLLVESLPGFSGLRLPYQLTQATALAVSLLAAAALHGRARRWVPFAVGLLLFEVTQVSPAAGLPATVSVRPQPAIRALSVAPPGAVMNHPFVPVRSYLYEQTVHRKPIAGRVDSIRNRASRRLWKRIRSHAIRDPAGFRDRVSIAAKKAGIRYVVLHTDPDVPPNMYDATVNALERAYAPMPTTGADDGEPNTTRVISLWR